MLEVGGICCGGVERVEFGGSGKVWESNIMYCIYGIVGII